MTKNVANEEGRSQGRSSLGSIPVFRRRPAFRLVVATDQTYDLLRMREVVTPVAMTDGPDGSARFQSFLHEGRTPMPNTKSDKIEKDTDIRGSGGIWLQHGIKTRRWEATV